jgi:hypothetical protein
MFDDVMKMSGGIRGRPIRTVVLGQSVCCEGKPPPETHELGGPCAPAHQRFPAIRTRVLVAAATGRHLVKNTDISAPRCAGRCGGSGVVRTTERKKLF